jgi:uncharacterized protein (TIGR02271 family)
MQTTKRATAVGVFENRQEAQRAVQELKRLGFRDDQIGIAHKEEGSDSTSTAEGGESYASEGALAGAATGAGIGALWGLGIAAGILPAIGPVIAGGTLAAILASAATGAAAATLVGAMIGMGIPEDEAKYYEGELHSGRTVVTVKAESRYDEAQAVLSRFNGYDMHARKSSMHSSSSSAQTGSHGTSFAATTPASARSTQTAQGGANQKIQLHEEELDVSTTPVQTGEVRVRKEVHNEQRTIQVPVKHEEIVIERHAVSGGQTGGTIGKNEEIRIPVSEEKVHVDKTSKVKEEVNVGKRQVQETKEVSGTVRKEEVRVEKEGDVDVREKKSNRK